MVLRENFVSVPRCSNTQHPSESEGSKEACQKLAAPISEQVLGVRLLVLQGEEQSAGPSQLGDGNVGHQLVLSVLSPICRQQQLLATSTELSLSQGQLNETQVPSRYNERHGSVL